MINNLFKSSAKLLIIATIAVGLFFGLTQNTHAQPSNEHSIKYGLIVHNANQNQYVTRAKAIEVLLKYFADIQIKNKNGTDIKFIDISTSSNAFKYIEKGCNFDLFDCLVEKFNPEKSITQMDFLSWFFKLKYFDNPDFLNKKYPFISDKYNRYWLEARSLNLITENQITYRTLQEFLYRNDVVKANLNQPFRIGLTLDSYEINAENFHNLKEIDIIQQNLADIVNNLEKKDKLTPDEKTYLANIEKNLKAFNELKESLIRYPYILRNNFKLSAEAINSVKQYGLQDVLYSYSYDYSRNAAYRKHNLVTGAMKMNGKVFMPGDIIDYWKEISDKGLREFQYGWVISQGEEEWQFGGGICGSASVVFLPSWSAGLEILERRNHSKFYRNLYPIEYIGLDATVYRPRPNLKIKNNMNSHIVYSVIDDKEKQIVTVTIISNKSYKNVRIEGPIFINKYYVKWVRHYEDFNGKITSDALESRYSAIY